MSYRCLRRKPSQVVGGIFGTGGAAVRIWRAVVRQKREFMRWHGIPSRLRMRSSMDCGTAQKCRLSRGTHWRPGASYVGHPREDHMISASVGAQKITQSVLMMLRTVAIASRAKARYAGMMSSSSMDTTRKSGSVLSKRSRIAAFRIDIVQVGHQQALMMRCDNGDIEDVPTFRSAPRYQSFFKAISTGWSMRKR